ncbi:MAG: hypothetical protein WCY10_01165, partial [Candidatus Omnitrophota bacterium]
ADRDTQEYKDLQGQQIIAGAINGLPAPFGITSLSAVPSAVVDTSKWNALVRDKPVAGSVSSGVTEPAAAAGTLSVEEFSDKYSEKQGDFSTFAWTPQTYTAGDLISDAALVATVLTPVPGDEVAAATTKSAQVLAKVQALTSGSARTGLTFAGVNAGSIQASSLISGNGAASLDETVRSAYHGYGQGYLFNTGIRGLGMSGLPGKAGGYLEGGESSFSAVPGRYLTGMQSTLDKYLADSALLPTQSLEGAKSFVVIGPVFSAAGTALDSIGESYLYTRDQNGDLQWGVHNDFHLNPLTGPGGESGSALQILALHAAESPKTGLTMGPMMNIGGLTTSAWDPAGQGLSARWAANAGESGYVRGTFETLLGKTASGSAAQESWLTSGGSLFRKFDDAAFFSLFDSTTRTALESETAESFGINKEDAANAGLAAFFFIPRYGGSNAGTVSETSIGDQAAIRKVTGESGAEAVSERTGSRIGGDVTPVPLGSKVVVLELGDIGNVALTDNTPVNMRIGGGEDAINLAVVKKGDMLYAQRDGGGKIHEVKSGGNLNYNLPGMFISLKIGLTSDGVLEVTNNFPSTPISVTERSTVAAGESLVRQDVAVDPSGNKIQRPVVDARMDPVKADAWVNAHPPELRAMARTIVDNIRYIDYPEFKAGMRTSVEMFNKEVDSPFIAVVVGGDNKSNGWALNIAQDFGLEPEFIVPDVVVGKKQGKVIARLIANPDIKDVLISDDASYSGQQIGVYVSKLQRDIRDLPELRDRGIKIHILVPFATDNAIAHVSKCIQKESGTTLTWYRDPGRGRIETVADIFSRLQAQDPKYAEIYKDVEENYVTTGETVGLTYFQHKAPDLVSFLHGGGEEGLLDGAVVARSHPGVIEGVRFIPPIISPYKQGYTGKVEVLADSEWSDRIQYDALD